MKRYFEIWRGASYPKGAINNHRIMSFVKRHDPTIQIHPEERVPPFHERASQLFIIINRPPTIHLRYTIQRILSQLQSYCIVVLILHFLLHSLELLSSSPDSRLVGQQLENEEQLYLGDNCYSSNALYRSNIVLQR